MEFADKIKTIGLSTGSLSTKSVSNASNKMRVKKGGIDARDERTFFHTMMGKKEGEKAFARYGEGRARKALGKKKYEEYMDQQSSIDKRLPSYNDG